MIVCIGYAIEDGPVESFYMDRMWLSGDGEGWRADEAALLSKFWEIVANARPVRFVGHNVLDFDLRHIVQRSVVHNIRQYGNISFVRFRNDPIFDTMQEWCKWRGGVKLAELALALGLPSPKTDMDGSGVAKAYAECKFEQISEYCKRDVETTRQVYKRIQGI
jgi:predicted PolB exonuclease-like 3'-5' exonuclease